MEPPACPSCGETTYPAAWCMCDPRRQLALFDKEGVVYLQREDEEVPLGPDDHPT